MTDKQTEFPNTLITPELKPVTSSERIDVMDVLRGFALIGIIFMNIEWFSRAIAELGKFDVTLTGIDYAAGWFVKVFIEGKFYKLFSILFGMGFAVMLLRAQDVGRPFGSWFIRRMLILFIIGMAHMIFLWGGDIVHDYAVAGLLLLAWIKITSTKRMGKYQQQKYYLRIGLVMLALPIAISTFASIVFGMVRDVDKMTEDWQQRVEVRATLEKMKVDNPYDHETMLLRNETNESEEIKQEQEQDEAKMSDEEIVIFKAEQRYDSYIEINEKIHTEIEAFTQDNYWTATLYRIDHALDALKYTPIMALFVLFPLFMIGFWFISSGVLKEPEKHLILFKNMAWIGLSLGLFLSIAGVFPRSHPAAKDAIEVKAVADTVFFLGQYLFTAGYLGGIVLLMQTSRGKTLLSWLAPMGRMALTNYIMHSIILSSIFFGYAGGAYGLISRAPQIGIAIAIILTQLLISRWWLMKFRYGPLEWIWRSLTYLKVQPMLVK